MKRGKRRSRVFVVGVFWEGKSPPFFFCTLYEHLGFGRFSTFVLTGSRVRFSRSSPPQWGEFFFVQVWCVYILWIV